MPDLPQSSFALLLPQPFVVLSARVAISYLLASSKDEKKRIVTNELRSPYLNKIFGEPQSVQLGKQICVISDSEPPLIALRHFMVYL